MEAWRSTNLDAVCDLIKRGVAPKYIDDGGLCVLNQRCIRDHAINFSLARRHDTSQKNVPPEKIVRQGDVLVNSTGIGTLGRVAQVREAPMVAATVDSHVTIVRPKPGLFYPDFFGYMLVRIEDEITASGEGSSGQTELPRKTLSERFQVRYPESLSEQERIVAILDEAFTAIATATANAERNLANARELFESQLNAVLEDRGNGWTESALGDLITIKHGFAFKSQGFATAGKYVLLTPGNFYETGGYRDRGEKQKCYVGEMPEGFILDEGDLLVAMTEQAPGLLGSPLIVPESGRFLHNQRLGLVVSSKHVVHGSP